MFRSAGGTLIAYGPVLGSAPRAWRSSWSHRTPRPGRGTLRSAGDPGRRGGRLSTLNFIDQNNELQGFEVDLLKALCEVMKARCSPVPHEWDGIVRGSSITNTTPSCRRSRSRSGASAAPPSPAATTASRRRSSGGKDADLKQGAEALAGKRIGAVDRSEHATYILIRTQGSGTPDLRELDEANLDLLTGRLDYVIGDKLPSRNS